MTDTPERLHTAEIAEAGLHAYADGLLSDSPFLRAAVEARLAKDPEARRKVEDLRAINAAIRAAYPPVTGEASHLAAAFGRKKFLPYRLLPAASAMAAALVAGFFIGQHMSEPANLSVFAAAPMEENHARNAAGTFAADAAMAGVEAVRAEKATGKRIEMTRAVPDLSKAGFILRQQARVTGERSDPMLRALYGNAAGEEVELLIVALPVGNIEPERRGAGATGRIYWSDGYLAYGLTATNGAPDLERLARLAASPDGWDIALEENKGKEDAVPADPLAEPAFNRGIQPIVNPAGLQPESHGS